MADFTNEASFVVRLKATVSAPAAGSAVGIHIGLQEQQREGPLQHTISQQQETEVLPKYTPPPPYIALHSRSQRDNIRIQRPLRIQLAMTTGVIYHSRICGKMKAWPRKTNGASEIVEIRNNRFPDFTPGLEAKDFGLTLKRNDFNAFLLAPA